MVLDANNMHKAWWAKKSWVAMLKLTWDHAFISAHEREHLAMGRFKMLDVTIFPEFHIDPWLAIIGFRHFKVVAGLVKHWLETGLASKFEKSRISDFFLSI